ncbi:Protein MSS51 [Fusarium oxysporum f. sp. albedinis]|nr:Protein MSS51 [Fusarium oxysporum f. sp. albedinis]
MNERLGCESEDQRRGKFSYHDPGLKRQCFSAVDNHERQTFGVFRETKSIDRIKDGCRGNAGGANQERRLDEDATASGKCHSCRRGCAETAASRDI